MKKILYIQYDQHRMNLTNNSAYGTAAGERPFLSGTGGANELDETFFKPVKRSSSVDALPLSIFS